VTDPLRAHVRAAALLAACLLATAGCAGTPAPATPEAAMEAPAADGTVEIILLQMNDVYEIGPVSGGQAGGLARVATVRKRLLQEDPDVVTLIAGDLFSPSAMGTAQVGGKALDGKQMVAVLNELGLDWATYGNHEFDLKEGPFFERLAESEFRWVSANVTAADGSTLPGTVETAVLTLGEEDEGRPVRLGLVGVTLTDNDPDYVTITDPLPALERAVEALRPQVDVLVALTHLSLDQDVQAVEEIAGIDLSLGGHEHENVQVWRGADLTPVMKADANARTVYVHRLRVAPDGGLTVRSELLPITADIPDDPATAAVVERWTEAAFDGFRRQGFEPEEVVAVTDVTLDGREASVRNRPTDLTRVIADSMAAAAGVDVAVFNGGSIRIDDELPPGPVTQYDVLRVLPFGGEVQTVEIRGDVLVRALDQGAANAGSGGYLQTTANVAGETGSWTIGGEPIDPARTYAVAMNDYLASGKQSTLEFLAPTTEGFAVTGDHGDIRQALIAELRRRWPAGSGS
jgi:5'-nucleotidase / UDP-sugar diphosphatase